MVLRKSARDRRADESEILRLAIGSGISYSLDLDGRRLRVPTMAELEQFWREHEHEYTADLDKGFAGTRCWAWWQWSIPPGIPRPWRNKANMSATSAD